MAKIQLKMPANADYRGTVLAHSKSICRSVASREPETVVASGSLLLTMESDNGNWLRDDVAEVTSTDIAADGANQNQPPISDADILEALLVTAKAACAAVALPGCIVQVKVIAKIGDRLSRIFFAQAIIDTATGDAVLRKVGIKERTAAEEAAEAEETARLERKLQELKAELREPDLAAVEGRPSLYDLFGRG